MNFSGAVMRWKERRLGDQLYISSTPSLLTIKRPWKYQRDVDLKPGVVV